MLSRHRPDGRVSLLNTALRIENRDGMTKRTVGSLADLHKVMTGEFALPVDHSLAEQIWLRLETLGRVERLAG